MPRLLRDLCKTADIPTTELPDGLRQRDTGTHRFLFNYAPEPIPYAIDRIVRWGDLSFYELAKELLEDGSAMDELRNRVGLPEEGEDEDHDDD